MSEIEEFETVQRAEGDTAAATDHRQRRGSTLRRRLEVAATIALALATVLTAWSVFQSSKWSGVMSIRFSEAAKLRTDANFLSNRAGQITLTDAAFVAEWVAAIDRGDTDLAAAYGQLFTPELQSALDAAGGEDLTALAEVYQVSGAAEAIELADRADAAAVAARDANQTSDNYVLTTVLLASVLFFAGIATKLTSTRVYVALVVLGWITLVVSGIILLALPVEI